jgi:hypothetical protein
VLRYRGISPGQLTMSRACRQCSIHKRVHAEKPTHKRFVVYSKNALVQ